MSISIYYPFFVNFLNSSFTRSVSVTCCSFCTPHFVCSFVLHSCNQSWLATHFVFNFFFFFFFVVASSALVVGMQDNEYTDAQVGDAGGLFQSLDPAPCGAVPAYLIHCSSSNLPDPVLRFQSIPHPVLQSRRL